MTITRNTHRVRGFSQRYGADCVYVEFETLTQDKDGFIFGWLHVPVNSGASFARIVALKEEDLLEVEK